MENLSEHPLSDAIAEYALLKIKNKNLKVERFQALEGRGVKGFIDGREILMGNKRLMDENTITVEGDLKKNADSLILEGKTTIFMSVGGKTVAVFALADVIKKESLLAIKHLHKIGMKVVMLTGDNKKTAQVIAKQLDIDKVVAEVLPQEKAGIVKKLQEELGQEGIVAMVGDGINDAPALAQADIGIAMGTGTDVAIEAGDLVLVKGTLDKVIEAISLSRLTLSVIKQNLFWAFGYNIIAIPVAAGLLYPKFGLLLSPIIASAAMAFSSISVLVNSLRLKILTEHNKMFSDAIFYLFIFGFVVSAAYMGFLLSFR